MRVKRHQSHSLRTHLLKLPATLLGILKHPIPKLNRMTLETHHRTKLESKCKYVKHLLQSHSRSWDKIDTHTEISWAVPNPSWNLGTPKTNLNPNNPPKTITKRKSAQNESKTTSISFSPNYLQLLNAFSSRNVLYRRWFGARTQKEVPVQLFTVQIETWLDSSAELWRQNWWGLLDCRQIAYKIGG
jgi:hypothetical protein